MDRELSFHPEKEHTRDLVYSEYSSCDRSVHLLIQDTPSVPYDVLLKVYRETVSAYLSSEEIRPPEDFIENLLARFDGLAEAAALPIDRWGDLGLHLLLRTKNAFYIVTSREAEVFVHVGGALEPVLDACHPARLRFDRGTVQRELFPSRLGDLLSALKVDPARVGSSDLVLGCPESDKTAVLDGLSNPLWLDPDAGAELRASRRSIVSGSVSRRILVLRFGDDGQETAQTPPPRNRTVRFPRIALSRRAGAVGAVILVAAAAFALWKGSDGGRRTVALETAPPTHDADSRAGLNPTPEGRPTNQSDRTATWRLTEAWRRSLPDAVTSSPVIFDGKVIFGCRDGVVYALDPATGSSLWTFTASGGVGASPAIRGESVIVADYNGYVYALAAQDGSQSWRTKLATSVVSSPAVSGERVLVCGVDGYAYCLSALDGQVVWKKRTRGRIRGSAVASDGSFLVPSYDGYLYSFSAILGTVEWRSALGGPVSATPGAQGGFVVIGGPDGKVLCLGAGDGVRKWNFTAGDAVKSSAAISGDRVFVGSNDGCLYCLDVSNGALRWKYQTGGVVLGRPVEADGVVYAGSYDGRMYGLDGNNGTALGAFEAGGEIFSSPALDGDRVYFGTNGGDFIALWRSRN
jgi:outer membrane protein assembly factor BamB